MAHIQVGTWELSEVEEDSLGSAELPVASLLLGTSTDKAAHP